MNKINITENFYIHEFTNRNVRLITPFQWMMLQNLCNNLEAIRAFLNSHFNKKVYITITDGIRLPSDINALKKKGFRPSETSDHLFGNIIKLRSRAKIKQFGKYYNFSVGAGDLKPSCGAKEAFEALKPFFNRNSGIITLPSGDIHVGQLILERRVYSERESYWLHISNPPELIYSEQIVASFLTRKHFLISLNNGASYESV